MKKIKNSVEYANIDKLKKMYNETTEKKEKKDEEMLSSMA